MDLEVSGLRTLEHVAVTVSITHPRRGSLELKLFCPSGMMSLIGAPRSMDSYVYLPVPAELSVTRASSRERELDAGTVLRYHGMATLQLGASCCGLSTSAHNVLSTALYTYVL